MKAVAVVLLTLFSWMVSSGTWLSLDHCADLSQYGTDEETKVSSSRASCINAHDKTNVTQTCKSCMNLLQTSKDTVKQSEHGYKCNIQQSLVCFLSKAGCVLHRVKVSVIQTDSHSVRFNRSTASASDCFCSITRVLVNSWETTACKFEVTVLPVCLCRQYGAAVLKICILSEIQVSLMSSDDSKTGHVRICCLQMLSKFLTYSQKDVFLTHSDGIKYTAHTGSAGPLWVTLTSRWVQILFLVAVLLLGIYMTRLKMLPYRVSAARGSNATIVILFTVTFHSFSPSLTVQLSPEWTHIAVVICLSCALGRAVHMLLACRFCPTQQKFRALPVTALLFWLTFRPSFSNKNSKDCPEDILEESSMGSSLKSWAALKQIELLATLYCMVVSLPCLLQSIVTKLNFLGVFLHVHLVTCLQNRLPMKYVLVIRINRV